MPHPDLDIKEDKPGNHKGDPSHPYFDKPKMFGGFAGTSTDDDDGAYKAGYTDAMQKSAYRTSFEKGMDAKAYKTGYQKGMDALDNDDDVEKSVTENALLKSLDHLDETVQKMPPSRKDELLQKSQRESLTEAESYELTELLQGRQMPTMAPSDDLEKSLDASNFLREIWEGTSSSLSNVIDRLEKSTQQNREFNHAIVDVFRRTGQLALETHQLVKSLETRLDEWGTQPARAPKAQRTPVVQEKNFGSPASGDTGNQLSKAVVLDCLEEMLEKSEKGEYGQYGLAKCGVKLHPAIVEYETSSQLPAKLAQEVLEYHQKQNR